MSSLFDFDSEPTFFAVMGDPIAHSRSPSIHHHFAEQCGKRIRYEKIQVDPGGFPQAVSSFFANDGRGLNITVPFKHEAFALADELSERAQKAKAVNTFIPVPNGLKGDNTDGIGFVRDLRDNHQCALAAKGVLILGAGGASRGVLGPILEERPQQLFIANRTPDKAEALAQEFAQLGTIAGGGYKQLEGQQFDIVINATSASLSGDLPPLPDQLLREGAWCYDMMYGKEDTVFMRWAREHGAQHVTDGLGMLVEQAAEAFAQWHGVHPKTQSVIAALRAELNAT